MNRAYSVLTIKSVDSEQRIITGVASTPETDRVGDIVESKGLRFKNPVPLLLFHKRDQPVGKVWFEKPTRDGINFRAHIPTVEEPGVVRDRTDEAFHSAKYGLTPVVSIGFSPDDGKVEPLKSGGLRFMESELLELSLVTIAANPSAVIQQVKHLFATDDTAASGTSHDGISPTSAGVTAPVARTGRKDARRMNTTMTYQDQIKDLTNQRAATEAQLEAVQRKATDEGRAKDESEREEFKELKTKILNIDNELSDLRDLEKISVVSKAVPVAGDTPKKAADTRDGKVIMLSKTYPKGTLFTRYAMAVAAGKGSISDTIAYAKRWEHDTPEVLNYIRRAVEGTSEVTTSPSWGGQLVYQDNLAGEFIELLRPATIIGRISGFRMVPPNVRIARQTGGSTVNWVGEAAPKPVSELDFDTISLGYNKIAGIVVLTEELVRLSSPSAEETVRRDLVEQIARFIDSQFLNPAVTAGANNPASITNGVASPAASGTDAEALYLDMNTALATFDGQDMGTNSIVILMPPALARGISSLRNALGQFEFSDVNMGGGTLLGFPVIVSSSVPSGTIVIVKADEIYLSDDGRVTLDASNQATLDMNGGASPTFNLWQRNCVGIRAERWITWAKRRADAVAIIDTASYGPSVGSP